MNSNVDDVLFISVILEAANLVDPMSFSTVENLIAIIKQYLVFHIANEYFITLFRLQ